MILFLVLLVAAAGACSATAGFVAVALCAWEARRGFRFAGRRDALTLGSIGLTLLLVGAMVSALAVTALAEVR